LQAGIDFALGQRIHERPRVPLPPTLQLSPNRLLHLLPMLNQRSARAGAWQRRRWRDEWAE
jgi:hypothetical protein